MLLATLPRKISLTEPFIRLKRLRQEHHLSQVQLAAMTGVPSGTIAAWESGRVQSLDLDSIGKLAPAFGMSVEALTAYLTATDRRSGEPPPGAGGSRPRQTRIHHQTAESKAEYDAQVAKAERLLKELFGIIEDLRGG